MSTATLVPETTDLESEDALATLRSTGLRRLATDAFARFRAADGFSHTRALAFQVTLTALPALIAVVGLAAALDQDTLRQVIEGTLNSITPGPTGELFTQAFNRASGEAGSTSGKIALVSGLVTAMISMTLAMAQLERGANRIYGVERDRPSVSKYWHGFWLACTVGTLVALAAVLLVAGRAVGDALGAEVGGALATAWRYGRWPVGVLLVIVGFALLFKESPRRIQPSPSWLAFGSGLGVVLWLLFTALLAIYLEVSKAFGTTYGPLAGLVGGMLWALLTSFAVYLGLAFAAQLEAVRAGAPGPTTGEEANPESATARSGA